MSFFRLLLVLIAVLAIPASAEAPGGSLDPISARILASHNAERSRLGIAPLAWNPQLAQQARAWAQSLSARRMFHHSRNSGGAGESLWMGTSGAYSPEEMIEAFIEEKRYFRPGRFPGVSRTGRWSDVGHYTQLIWPATRELGCALVKGRSDDVLVCRYFPAGNVIGQRVP